MINNSVNQKKNKKNNIKRIKIDNDDDDDDENQSFYCGSMTAGLPTYTGLWETKLCSCDGTTTTTNDH